MLTFINRSPILDFYEMNVFPLSISFLGNFGALLSSEVLVNCLEKVTHPKPILKWLLFLCKYKTYIRFPVLAMAQRVFM